MKKNEITIGKKAINATVATARKEAKEAGKRLGAERKSLAATISFLAASESEEGAKFRAFFGLPKGANAKARKEAAKRVEALYINVVEVRYYDWDNDIKALRYTGSQYVPATATGKIITDYLTEVINIVARERARAVQRRMVITAAWELRRKMIDKDNYMSYNHLFWRAVGVIPAKKTPRKYCGWSQKNNFACLV